MYPLWSNAPKLWPNLPTSTVIVKVCDLKYSCIPLTVIQWKLTLYIVLYTLKHGDTDTDWMDRHQFICSGDRTITPVLYWAITMHVFIEKKIIFELDLLPAVAVV